MFEVSIKAGFSAAHHLREYEGKCADPHGHNWDVEVFVCGEKLQPNGILLDFRLLKDNVQQILAEVDHTDLNSHAFFSEHNPTSENLAMFLFERLATTLNCGAYRVARVLVSETPGSRASYRE